MKGEARCLGLFQKVPSLGCRAWISEFLVSRVEITSHDTRCARNKLLNSLEESLESLAPVLRVAVYIDESEGVTLTLSEVSSAVETLCGGSSGMKVMPLRMNVQTPCAAPFPCVRALGGEK